MRTERMRVFLRLYCTLCACLLGCATTASAAVWYVDIRNCAGGDGSSWASAMCTIQPAIDAAAAAGGGQVWVAEGTYAEDRGAETGALDLKPHVHLYGGFASGESSLSDSAAQLHPVVIDAKTSRSGEAGIHAIVIQSEASLHAVTITNAAYSGVYMAGASDVILTDCLIENNLSGGGLVAASCKNLYMSRCTFKNNFSVTGGGAVVGGFACTIEDCVFEGNTAYSAGGANMVFDRAVRCIWRDNHASQSGPGGLSFEAGVLESCQFIGNSAPDSGAISCGRIDETPQPFSYEQCLKIRNCLFVDNHATDGGNPATNGQGGAISATFFTPCWVGEGRKDNTLDNKCYWPPIVSGCTFVNNSASVVGGAIYSNTGGFPITNCIFWGNGDDPIVLAGSGAGVDTVTYSIVEGGFVGNTNYSAPPVFVDASSGDYRLQANSPGVDFGRSTTEARYGGTDVDYFGNARGFDGDGQGSTAKGDGSDYDIGAFEYVGVVAEGEGEGEGDFHAVRITADQNADFVIQLSELLRVIQLYNALAYHCEVTGEDGFAVGTGDSTCQPHGSDYAPQDWKIGISEILRLVQFYNSLGYHYCPSEVTEDSFCVGA